MLFTFYAQSVNKATQPARQSTKPSPLSYAWPFFLPCSMPYNSAEPASVKRVHERRGVFYPVARKAVLLQRLHQPDVSV